MGVNRICEASRQVERSGLCIHIHDSASPLPCGRPEGVISPICSIAQKRLDQIINHATGGISCEVKSESDTNAELWLDDKLVAGIVSGRVVTHKQTLLETTLGIV